MTSGSPEPVVSWCSTGSAYAPIPCDRRPASATAAATSGSCATRAGRSSRSASARGLSPSTRATRGCPSPVARATSTVLPAGRYPARRQDRLKLGAARALYDGLAVWSDVRLRRSLRDLAREHAADLGPGLRGHRLGLAGQSGVHLVADAIGAGLDCRDVPPERDHAARSERSERVGVEVGRRAFERVEPAG